MTPQKVETSVGSQAIRKGLISSYFAGEATEFEFEINEGDPLSEKEFRTLLIFVVTAICAFGSMVNGWLI
jgi:hypothetical protein